MASLDELGEDYKPTEAALAVVMLAKRHVLTAAVEVVDVSMEVVGGSSYFRHSPLERAYRDPRLARLSRGSTRADGGPRLLRRGGARARSCAGGRTAPLLSRPIPRPRGSRRSGIIGCVGAVGPGGRVVSDAGEQSNYDRSGALSYTPEECCGSLGTGRFLATFAALNKLCDGDDRLSRKPTGAS